MRRFELYIGDSLIEIDDKFDFTMLLKSSVFTELTSVQANRTTTVKIPKTANNLRAIDFSNIPENNTLFPYRTKPVELFKNGLPIIQDGKGWILSISDYIEFSIIWGVNVDIKELQNLKLRDLPGDEYVDWDETGFGEFITDANGFGFAFADFIDTDNLDYKLLIYHPFVLVDWIFEKIKSNITYSINFPDYIDDIFDCIAIPMIDKNPSAIASGDDDLHFNFDGNFQINVVDDPSSFVSGNQIVIKEDCIVSFSGSTVYKFLADDAISNCDWAQLRIFKNGIFQTLLRYYPFSGVYEIELTDDISFECSAGDRITFQLEVKWRFDHGIFSMTKTTWNNSRDQSEPTTGYLTMGVKPRDVKPGQKFPIIPNLPDMTAYELLQTIMAMFGLFGIYTSEGIEFYNIEDFYSKKDGASDWTNKVITGSNIDTLTFALDSFTQKNWLKYADDDTVKTNANGFITSDNDTLDSERTIYQLKFAASDGSTIGIGADSSLMYVPLYTPKIDDNGVPVLDDSGNITLDYNKGSDRIGMITYSNNKSFALFPSNIYFAELISRFYYYYQQVVLNPKIVEVQFILSDMDIFNLDIMNPVYLEQTGNYYIIQELNISANNVAKAKLIQM